MAVVVYKCDTCKRQIEKKRKPNSLEIIQRCIITEGCRGKLYQVNIFKDYIRGSLPDNVAGLDNWVQRKKLFTYRQTLKRSTWNIEHNLGTVPSVQTYYETTEGDFKPVTPINTEIIDQNNVTITFNRSYSGIAQLIARSTEGGEVNSSHSQTTTTSNIIMSKSGVITIAVPEDNVDIVPQNGSPNTKTFLYATFKDNNTINTIDYGVQLATSNSPWSDFNQKIIIGNQLFNIYTLEPDTTTDNIPDGSILTFNLHPQQYDLVDNNGQSLKKVLVLLANEPQLNFDKITSSYLDITNLTSNGEAFIQDNEIFVSEDTLTNIYPPIRPL